MALGALRAHLHTLSHVSRMCGPYYGAAKYPRWLYRLSVVIYHRSLSRRYAKISFRHARPPEIAKCALRTAMYLMRVWTKAEVALVSIGRVKEFSDLESEAANFTNEPLPSSWPSGGKVVMDHVSARYAPDLPKSLDDICFTVNAGEKVAVVGATGSGKSTLSLTLLRIIEACEGRIHIDDVDVSRIGLHDLRSRVTIVPQDPVSPRKRDWLSPPPKLTIFQDHLVRHAQDCFRSA